MRKFFYILPLIIFSFTFTGDPSSWIQVTLPVNDVVNDIFFIDSFNGWIVTQGDSSPIDTGYIMRTTNGGDNWSIQYLSEGNFQTLQFLDINTGYVGGGSGSGTRYLYKTTNGGDNWIQIMGSFGVGTMVVDMGFLNKDTGWICDESGFDGGIFKTTNGGLNWIQQVNSGLFSRKVFFTSADTGWFIDGQLPGHLYKSTNGGTNWFTQFTAPDDLRNIYFLNSQTGFIGGPFGGHSLKKTTNGGVNWVSTIGSQGGRGICFPNQTTGWICDVSGLLQKTTDGGLNWSYIGMPFYNFFSVHFSDPLHGWVGGTKIFRTTDGGITNIGGFGNEIINDFKLNQNYPNPFNPVTNVKFKIKSFNFVRLSVFDIAGKEVAILVNEKLLPGEYEYLFDGSNLTSGIYFYRLSADGSIIDTKKMVLVK